MSEAMRALAKRMLPQSARRIARALFGWRWFEGDFATWAEARAQSGGYDDAALVQRVADATRKVRAGAAAFERDSVCFEQPVAEPGLLRALRRVAEASGGHLRVLDFGGALGTTYWRHREELQKMGQLRWDVVEQARFVAAGREFAGSTLRFFPTVAAAKAAGPHDVLLASTSLQYLEDPPGVLAEWTTAQFPWLLFNNLPLHSRKPDRIAVQRVPPTIYHASYPVWFFNREAFLARLEPTYDLVQEFASEAIWPVGWRSYASTGLLWRKKGERR